MCLPLLEAFCGLPRGQRVARLAEKQELRASKFNGISSDSHELCDIISYYNIDPYIV